MQDISVVLHLNIRKTQKRQQDIDIIKVAFSGNKESLDKAKIDVEKIVRNCINVTKVNHKDFEFNNGAIKLTTIEDVSNAQEYKAAEAKYIASEILTN